jgi:hypothetical protein
MNVLSWVKSVLIDKGERMIKVLRGNNDARTADQVSPFGIDSSPINDLIAIYAETEGDTRLIMGYLNKDQLAAPGETRIYSVDETGGLKTYAWVKKDGTIELGGDSHNLVRYVPLNTGLQDFVTFINQQLALISSGIATAGGSYTPGTATINISESKIEELKTL